VHTLLPILSLTLFEEIPLGQLLRQVRTETPNRIDSRQPDWKHCEPDKRPECIAPPANRALLDVNRPDSIGDLLT
jgi:hypothetical protein